MAPPPLPRSRQPFFPRVERARATWSGFDPAARRFLVGSAFMGAAHAFPWTLLSLYLDAGGLSKPQIGFVLSGEAWGKLAAALPAALLLARLKDATVLARASLAAAVLYVVLPWMPTRGTLFGLNAVAGFVWAIHYIAMAPFLFTCLRGECVALPFLRRAAQDPRGDHGALRGPGDPGGLWPAHRSTVRAPCARSPRTVAVGVMAGGRRTVCIRDTAGGGLPGASLSSADDGGDRPRSHGQRRTKG